ncbi:heterokaryon incompatibility protein-domain-containing protein, partial [Podospora aff. communis PSN243]
YATLSHWWGAGNPLQTTTANIEHHRKRIRFQDLPKAFKDAVVFTRSMKVRFLWIDSLCIIQDSEEDKNREIPRMAAIYSGSIFNIAASAAADCHAGCFQPRDWAVARPHIIRVDSISGSPLTRQSTVMRLLVSPSIHDEQNSRAAGYLDDRGWIIQQRIFAPRTFFFEKTFLLFHCSAMYGSERLPSTILWPTDPVSHDEDIRHGLRSDLLPRRDAMLESLVPFSRARALGRAGSELHKAAGEGDGLSIVSFLLAPGRILTQSPMSWNWSTIVELYARCTFTKESDRLLGISSLAGMLEKAGVGGRYIAGMWIRSLPEGLLWKNITTCNRPPIRRSKPYRAPSWSWACLEGPFDIRFDIHRLDQRHHVGASKGGREPLR